MAINVLLLLSNFLRERHERHSRKISHKLNIKTSFCANNFNIMLDILEIYFMRKIQKPYNAP